jgi:twitching motility protein PilT
VFAHEGVSAVLDLGVDATAGHVPATPNAAAIAPYLQALITYGGSDLHLKSGSAPRLRIDGVLRPLDAPALSAEDLLDIAENSMNRRVLADFQTSQEADYAIEVPGVGRFRVNVFVGRGDVAMVLRRVSDVPPTLEELGMPEIVSRMALARRGLVVVSGPTGVGKTTTLAAMVDCINESQSLHILTLEDPIDIVHHDKQSVVNQREVRTDTADFKTALRSAMRQDPDVILIGEVRDAETVQAMLQAAASGHLVLTTLHSATAPEAITRIIEFFPPTEQGAVRTALSATLRGVVCQRLVEREDGSGRIATLEILVNNARIADAIAEGRTPDAMAEIIGDSEYYGMQTFEQDLLRLVIDGTISIPVARAAASNLPDFDVALRRLGLDTEQRSRSTVSVVA